MDVDTLKATGAMQIPAVSPEVVSEARNRAEQAELKAEVKREKPDISIRSGRFRTSSFTSRIKGAVVSVPKKVRSDKVSVDKYVFDAESEQFRVVKKTIESANRRLVGANSMFQYNIHEKTKQIMIRVIDKETNELILEIPPEKALDAIAKMWELAGIFVDEKR